MALAWGGRAAQVAMISASASMRALGRRGDLQEDVAAYQVLPGPEAHELCVYFGRIRGGKLGGSSPGSASCCPTRAKSFINDNQAEAELEAADV